MTDRWIHLDGCANARDLGDLPTTAGGSTRRGLLIRCDTVQQLTVDATNVLINEFGLRTVLDLRTPKEAAAEGRGLLAETEVGYHNTAFIPDLYLVPGDPEHKVIVEQRSKRETVEHYLDYLTRPASAVPTALRLLTQPAELPTLFHCAAGKDRTGVLAALVLDIVGVRREAIVDDYVMTNERLPQIKTRLSAMPTYSRSARSDIGCRPETMVTFFETLDQRWGGAAGWALGHGITQAELDVLRKTLVD
ncbi:MULTISPECIES: tyrosine-protein phosphatase [unclassified Frankia]|uniref:tyrosine-protein phosphatase n=3 Tax=Frankia TaxID=1854 RepID=UPI002AD307B8|nr:MULTISPECIES: tyrosine-protein phosphatase [unclassified Frankia]